MRVYRALYIGGDPIGNDVVDSRCLRPQIVHTGNGPLATLGLESVPTGRVDRVRESLASFAFLLATGRQPGTFSVSSYGISCTKIWILKGGVQLPGRGGSPLYPPFYAHIEIVVTFLVVNFFGFLVITRNPTMRFGPKLEEIFLSASRSFLYLSGTFLKAINPSFFTPKFSEKNEKFNDYEILSVQHIKNQFAHLLI